MSKQTTRIKEVLKIGDTTAPATSAKQDSIISAINNISGTGNIYTLIFVEDGDNVYWAEALPGSLTTDEVWRAYKYDGTAKRILLADGDSDFDNKADDLTNLTYS